jgi:hypothetical protein
MPLPVFTTSYNNFFHHMTEAERSVKPNAASPTKLEPMRPKEITAKFLCLKKYTVPALQPLCKHACKLRNNSQIPLLEVHLPYSRSANTLAG